MLVRRLLPVRANGPLSLKFTPKRAFILRLYSTSIPPPESSDAHSSPTTLPPQDSGPPPPSVEEQDKPSGRPTKRTKLVKEKDFDQLPVALPDGLNILWTPGEADLNPDHLPPPELFSEALDKLNLTLHPHNQAKSASSTASPASEPTLCLYCPIEGGDYVLDSSVNELARRTNADVVVIDAAHLAAGDFGHFGEGILFFARASSYAQREKANPLHLPQNPLHVQSSPTSRAASDRSVSATETNVDPDEGPDEDEGFPFSLQLITRPANGTPLIPARRSLKASPKSKLQHFFDSVINVSGHVSTDVTSQPSGRARLVYIKNFELVAESSMAWYPALLQSVQERRRGSPQQMVQNPTTIVFGISPTIQPSSPRSPAPSPQQGLLQFLSPPPSHPPSIPSRVSKADFTESVVADRMREKRLQGRLRKWEQDDGSLQSEIPSLPLSPPDRSDSKPEVVIIGPDFPNMTRRAPVSSQNAMSFFKTAVILPRVRSTSEERHCRVSWRLKVNELCLRMAVGAIGGRLDAQSLDPGNKDAKDGELSADKGIDSSGISLSKITEDWGNRIEEWSIMRTVADRALGSVLTRDLGSGSQGAYSLAPTTVPWEVVVEAWFSLKSNRDLRKHWIKDVGSVKGSREMEEEDEESEESDGDEDIVERVKNAPDLDSHEQRLLPCIVNTESMPTSFSQVHLPEHTIDSIRTVVSLPLLHPHAFQHGILKHYGINGCLLFGPPGTGKTHLVRALAREAGCRMLVISPSDIMDMYVGEGEKLVKAVFSLARRLSPCVVFLDEIDALFRSRTSGEHSGGAFAHRGVITEFMQEMDGLTTSREDAVVVIGATNRPGDLDDAVLRRLPRRLLVDLPGEAEREAILRIMLRDELLAPDVELPSLARSTDSFSGSDLKHLCVSAALAAIKDSHSIPWLAKTSQGSQTTHIDSFDNQISNGLQETTKDITSATPTNETSDDHEHPGRQDEQHGEKSNEADGVPPQPEVQRVISLRHFNKALLEITPSSSENWGSLADLRKWNEEFGEGRKNRKRRQVWGKDRFGFTDKDIGRSDPRVLIPVETKEAAQP